MASLQNDFFDFLGLFAQPQIGKRSAREDFYRDQSVDTLCFNDFDLLLKHDELSPNL